MGEWGYKGGEGGCDSLETQEPGKVTPGICMCVYVHTHTIQTFREAARTRALHVDTEHSLQADTDHPQASYLNPRTQATHIGTCTHTHIRTHTYVEHILPRHTTHPRSTHSLQL